APSPERLSPAGPSPSGGARAAVVVTGGSGPGPAITRRLRAAGVVVEVISTDAVAPGFAAALDALDRAASTLGGTDALIVALPASAGTDVGEEWQSVLGGHAGLSEALLADAAW